MRDEFAKKEVIDQHMEALAGATTDEQRRSVLDGLFLIAYEQANSDGAMRERNYRRERDNERLTVMAAIVASGMSGNNDMTPEQIDDRALKIAQGLMRKVEALP
jgi:hypothetical protein